MILNDKDATTRMENIRYLRKGKDAPYSAVFNRPLRDIEERTNDLWEILDPAKQFYVHQASPASLTVVVEPGWSYHAPTVGTAGDPTYFPGDSVTVALCIPNYIRMDLIYYDMANNSVDVVTGTEVQESTGFAGLWDDPTPLRAYLPTAHAALVPLAYLYVGSRDTEVFQDATLINVAGYIRDVRIGSHANFNMMGNSTGDIVPDEPGGSAGSSQRSARSDHRHPLNVTTAGVTGSSAVTAKLNCGNSRVAGARNEYSRVDHVHDVDISGLVDYLEEDRSNSAQGDVGSRSSFVRSDHRHPLHLRDPADPNAYPGILDTEVSSYGGSGTYYTRDDHRHAITGNVVMHSNSRTLKWYAWNATYNKWMGETTTKSTGAPGLEPLFAITFCAGKFPGAGAAWTINWRDQPGYLSWGWVKSGSPPSWQRSLQAQDYWNAGHDWFAFSYDASSCNHIATEGLGYATSIQQRLVCNSLTSSGATFQPSGGYWHGFLCCMFFGFEVLP